MFKEGEQMNRAKEDNRNFILAGYRTMLGKTQEDFAELLGISKQSYNQKELGKNMFHDEEKKIIKEYISKKFPEITIDLLFFS